jgi:2-hydroxychromene-2-carboxylate isomerase
MPQQPLELWFEFASTYSYVAMEATASLDLPLPLRYRPFLLGPIFAAQGMQDSPFNLYPIKGRYMFRDLERLCRDAGLPWRVPSRFPRNGLLGARVALDNVEATWLPAFCRSVYRANFGFDREISEPSVIAELLGELGLDAAAVIEKAQAPAAKQALRAQNERASELGIFGAPTWVIGRELFWGADRMQHALAFWRQLST